jgi:hypothetical protein
MLWMLRDWKACIIEIVLFLGDGLAMAQIYENVKPGGSPLT